MRVCETAAAEREWRAERYGETCHRPICVETLGTSMDRLPSSLRRMSAFVWNAYFSWNFVLDG
jgi:hypothetical protein